jgi:hypothetical protein
MIGLTRNFVLAGGIMIALAAGPACAQDNLDAGKTPAQLYTSDCAICHKTPHGLGKNGTESFLREHYTASRESARAIASYLRENGGGTLPSAKRAHPVKRAGEEKAKPGEAKSHERKSATAKTGKEKSGEAKSEEPKTGKPKGKEAKDSKPKSGAEKPKASEPKSDKPKASEGNAKRADSGTSKERAPKTTASKKPAPKDVKPD